MRVLLIPLLVITFSASATEPAPGDTEVPAEPFAGAAAAPADPLADEMPIPLDPLAGESMVPAEPSPRIMAAARDRLELDSTSIRGNQELPRVLTIVPWKDPALGDLVGKPVNSLVDEALAPVDREVFRRQTSYFDQLYGGAE